MPNNKSVNARLHMRYDTPQNWDSSSIVPGLGEPILYRDGQTGAIYGLKFGDGAHTPTNLEFIGNDIVVDSALSTTSTNPVQNKIITVALGEKQNTLTAGNNVVIEGNTILVKSPSCTILNHNGLSFGSNSISNTKGFAILDINTSMIRISTTEPSTGQYYPVTNDIIGKYFSIISNTHFAFCGTVTSWDAAGDDVIIYYTPTTAHGTTSSSTTPWWTLQTIQDYAPLTHGVLWFPELPQLGYELKYGTNNEYLFFEDSTAIGDTCYASADDAFVNGESNVAGGNHAVIFGKLNKGGFGNIVNGIQNFSNGLHSALFGRYLVNHGDYNLLGGHTVTVEGNYHSIHGQSVVEDYTTRGNCDLGGGYNISFGGRCHLFGGRDHTIRGENHLIGGKGHDVSGENHLIGGHEHNVQGISHAVGGYGNTVSGTGHAVFGGKGYTGYNGNTVTNGYNSFVAGTGNTLPNGMWSFVFGFNNDLTGLSTSHVYAIGRELRPAKQYQFLTGRANVDDSGAALVIGNGTSTSNRSNCLTVGATGTRSFVDTDAVTVKYFNDHLPSAGIWHPLNDASSFTIDATNYYAVTCLYYGLGGTTDDFSTSTIIVGPRASAFITGTMDENSSYVTAAIDSNYNATITAPSGCYIIGYFA